MRDGLGVIEATAEVEALAQTEEDNGGVMFVPALAGLGAPYWDAYARGMIIGITRGTSVGHIARAALEGVALGLADALEAMEKDSGRKIGEIRVDGTSATYPFFMQLQTDLLQYPVTRPAVMPSSALGAAYLAGLATGFWDWQTVKKMYEPGESFSPRQDTEFSNRLRSRWKKAIARVQNWDL